MRPGTIQRSSITERKAGRAATSGALRGRQHHRARCAAYCALAGRGDEARRVIYRNSDIEAFERKMVSASDP
jgi:hypothetical protein